MTKYTKIPTELMMDKRLGVSERMVLFYLLGRSGSSKRCFPSISTMTSDIGMCRKTIVTAIKKLEQKGFIKKERRRNSDGGNTSNLYTVVNNAY